MCTPSSRRIDAALKMLGLALLCQLWALSLQNISFWVGQVWQELELWQVSQQRTRRQGHSSWWKKNNGGGQTIDKVKKMPALCLAESKIQQDGLWYLNICDTKHVTWNKYLATLTLKWKILASNCCQCRFPRDQDTLKFDYLAQKKQGLFVSGNKKQLWARSIVD